LREALELYQEAASAFDRLGDRWGVARTAFDLGLAHCDAGAVAAARASFARAVVAFGHLRHRRGVAHVLGGFARLAMGEQRAERALTLAVASQSVRDRLGATRPVDQAELKALLEWARRGLDHRIATEACQAALGLSLDDAIEFALSDEARPTTQN
jgi:hypothetical protein